MTYNDIHTGTLIPTLTAMATNAVHEWHAERDAKLMKQALNEIDPFVFAAPCHFHLTARNTR